MNNGTESEMFDKMKSYLLAKSLFDSSDVQFVYELLTDKVQPLADYLLYDDLIGKGFSINDCTYLGLITDGEEEESSDLIYRENGKKHGFKINRVMDYFPLIEGYFEEGIYRNINEDRYYRLNRPSDLSEHCSDTVEIGLDYDEYKIVCEKDRVQIVEIGNGQESILHTLTRYPFTYFDLYCPVCRSPIYMNDARQGGLSYSGSNLCELVEIKCSHYVGRVETENGTFVTESLDALKRVRLYENYPIEDHKQENSELYLKRRGEWVKAFVYTPRLNPKNSYWGKAQDGNYRDAFIFLTDKNLTVRREEDFIVRSTGF